MNKFSSTTLNSGNKIPIIGLGTWKLTDETADTIQTALQFGYKMIDTSGDYGTQPDIGEGIKQSGANRDDFYIVTKVEENENAYQATRRNLYELGLEYADLVLIHRPPARGAGESLWRDLIRAKKSGLTKDIGVSNYATDQMQELINKTGETPSVNQIEWSPFGYSKNMFDFCKHQGIVIQAYSPLTHGQLLGHGVLDDIADTYGKTPAQILIRWNLQFGTVPIVKANRIEHLHENLDVFDFNISRQNMVRLNRLNERYSALSPRRLYVKG